MKTYIIAFAVILTISLIADIVHSIAEKKDTNSFTSNISSILANGFGIISIFMFFGGLLTIFG